MEVPENSLKVGSLKYQFQSADRVSASCILLKVLHLPRN